MTTETQAQVSDEELTDEERAALDDPNNAANRTAVKTKARKQKDLDKRRAETVGALLSNAQTREFIGWLLCDVCSLFRPTANAAFDAQAMHFKEGARNVALILQDIAVKADVKAYFDMLKEWQQNHG